MAEPGRDAVVGAYVDGKFAGSGTAGSRPLNGEGGPIPADSRYYPGSNGTLRDVHRFNAS
ncbi:MULTISPECIES: hypothetical protein [unclassified Nonomuraea]|uniref:hypothetical protein n=1 Tax=unclassified Nonomuraea TaxID=2593643 RepID=UPI0033E961B3